MMTNPSINVTIKNVGTKPVSNGYHAYVTVEDTERDALKLKTGYFSKWFEDDGRADDYIRDLNKGDDVLLEYKVDGDFLNILHVSKVGSGGGIVEGEVPPKVTPPEKPVKAESVSVEDKLREEALLLPPGYLVRVVGHYREAIALSKELVGDDQHLQVVVLDKLSAPLNYLVTNMVRFDRDHAEEKKGGE